MKMPFALVLTLSASAATGQPADLSEARDGNLGAKIVITDDVESVFSGYSQPDTWKIFSTDRITRARPIDAVIIFHDCMAGPDGNCNVTVHFEMTAPNGRLYQHAIDSVAWKHLLSLTMP